MAARSRRPTAVIGWREWIALPDLGVSAVKAKIDTGARTSALHAFQLEVVERGGERRARFEIHPDEGSRRVVRVQCPIVGCRTVRSSNGVPERRPVISTLIELAGQRWPIEITLTNRDDMGFRMLIGRAAIRRKFTVDPGRSFRGAVQ